MPAARVSKAGKVGTAQVIVFRHGLGKSRDKFALGGDIAWSLELVLDPVCHRNLIGHQFERCQLVVALFHDFLQILVTHTQAVGLLAQRVVVGNLPGHAGVAGNKTENGETAYECECENDIKDLVRNMNST